MDGDRPDVGFHEDGYLYLASDDGLAVLKENNDLQRQLGADIVFMAPDELAQRFPWLNVEGLAAGTFGVSGEGWFDGYGLMQAFRRKARSLGVEYRSARVAGVALANGKVGGVTLADG